MLIITITILKTVKPNISNDEVINYEDTEKTINYLLEIKKPEEEVKNENADLNSTQDDTNSDDEAPTNNVARVLRSEENNTNSESNTILNNENRGIAYTNGVVENYTIWKSNSGKRNNNVENVGTNGVIEQNPSQSGGGNNNGGGQGQNNSPKPNNNYFSHIEKGKNEYNQTPKKGEELVVDLQIEITPYEEASSVIIDGKEVPVEHVINGVYRVKVPTPQSAGAHDIKITGIVLKNGKTVNSEYKFTVDVLKSIPEIKSLTVNSKKQLPELNIDIKDDDNAVTDGKVVVKDKAEKIVFEKNLSSNNKSYNLPLDNIEKDKEYTITVTTNYDLDSNAFGDIPENSGTITKTLKMKDDAEFGFEGTNWTLTPQVTDNDKLELTFENSYDSYYDVDKIIVSGKQYNVTKNGKKYKVELEKGTKGKNNITVEKVILTNEEQINVGEELSYIYLKEKPTAVVEPKEEGDKKITATLEITDKDNAIIQGTLKAILRDPDGKEIEKEINVADKSIEFTSEETYKAGNYTIEIVANYDLGDEIVHEKQVLGSKVVAGLIYAKIENAELKYYVTKNEAFEIIYTISSNTTEDPTGVIVNDKPYNLIKVSDGKYKAIVTAPENAGIKEYNATGIVYKDNQIESTYTTKVEVLKNTKPEVSDLTITTNDNDKPMLSFTIECNVGS